MQAASVRGREEYGLSNQCQNIKEGSAAVCLRKIEFMINLTEVVGGSAFSEVVLRVLLY